MRAFGLLLFGVTLAVAGCSRPQPPAASQPVFRPDVWFLGQMHSQGALKLVTGKPRDLAVASAGRSLPDGSVRLDQTIRWAGGAVDRRFWILQARPGGGYAVSLSDARGPVLFETAGARAHLRYRDKHGPMPLIVEQWMDLQPDGRTLANRGTLSVLGVPLAHMDETIVHDAS